MRRVQVCLVEIDMGTLTLRRFGRKVQAFEAALDDGVFRRQFPNREDFEVLVLTLPASSFTSVTSRSLPSRSVFST